mgnify:CR=1 FL=1
MGWKEYENNQLGGCKSVCIQKIQRRLEVNLIIDKILNWDATKVKCIFVAFLFSG